MSIDNYYHLLGVDRDATASEINSVFKQHTSQVHPDKSNAPDAEYWMTQLNKARNTLLDESSRKNYDIFLERFGPKRGHEEFLEWKKNGGISPDDWVSQETAEENTRHRTASTQNSRQNDSEMRTVICNLCGTTTPQTDATIFEDYFYCSKCTITTSCKVCGEPILITKNNIDIPMTCEVCYDHQSSREGTDWLALGQAIFGIVLFFGAAGVVGGSDVFDPLYNVPGGVRFIIIMIAIYLLYSHFKTN